MAHYNQYRQTTMFPNDDICNVDAAKQAAQRLFRRYRNRSGESGLGSNEVNRLMRATYEAINLPYDPNEQDVSSFISVFDSGNQGSIQLKDLEEMAVKYLCGTEAFLKDLPATKPTSPTKREKVEERRKSEQPLPEEQRSVKVERPQRGEPTGTKPIEKSWKKLTIDVAEPEEAPVQRVYTPSLSYKPPPISSFYSPKRPSFKDNLSSATTESASLRSQITTPKQKLSQSEIIQRGKDIFGQYSGGLGISEAYAGRVLGETYELFGKKNFVASGQDVRIWMKLCDKNKDGVVEWSDYEYFLLRTYERESQLRIS